MQKLREELQYQIDALQQQLERERLANSGKQSEKEQELEDKLRALRALEEKYRLLEKKFEESMRVLGEDIKLKAIKIEELES